MNILQSALGQYEISGYPTNADIIVGNSFGTSTHPLSPNGELAQFILDNEHGQPIVVDQTLADAFPQSRMLDVVVGGEISNAVGSVGGSWGVLVEAKEYMDEHDLSQPLIVAQAFHVGRVAMQATKLGMENLIVPKDLPDKFDISSEQPWTRSLGRWVPREVIGSVVLRRQGRL